MTIYTLAERVPVPLTMLHHPLCVTISFFHGGEVAILDAALQEHQMSEGEAVITANRHGEVCQIAKLGGMPIDALVLLYWVEVAIGKVRDLSEIITNALYKDAKEKNVGEMTAELSAENARFA